MSLPQDDEEKIHDIDLGEEPLSLPVTWADGTPFLIRVFSQTQWERLPAEGRPDAWLDETCRVYIAVSPPTS